MIVLELPDGGTAWHVAVGTGGRVAAFVDGNVWAADPADGCAWREMHPESEHGAAGDPYGLAFHPSGRWLAWRESVTNAVLVFDFTTGKRSVAVRPADGRLDDEPPQVLFSPDGSELWAVFAKRIRRTAGAWRALPSVPHAFPNQAYVRVSADGRTALAWSNTSTKAEDGSEWCQYHVRRPGEPARTVRVAGHWDNAVLGPDGGLFVARVDSGGFAAWDTGTGEERFRLPPDPPATGTFAFTPDGRTLLVGHGPLVRAFDTATWAERPALDWKAGAVKALAVSADGLAAAAGTATGRVVVWYLDG